MVETVGMRLIFRKYNAQMWREQCTLHDIVPRAASALPPHCLRIASAFRQGTSTRCQAYKGWREGPSEAGPLSQQHRNPADSHARSTQSENCSSHVAEKCQREKYETMEQKMASLALPRLRGIVRVFPHDVLRGGLSLWVHQER